MCGSMVDIQSPTAEIRRGNKRRKKKQDENIMVCPIFNSASLPVASLIKTSKVNVTRCRHVKILFFSFLLKFKGHSSFHHRPLNVAFEYESACQCLRVNMSLSNRSREGMQDGACVVGIGRLREELRAAARAKRSLERELVSARRDSDAMLDTLRRKERQFTDDHRQLEMKNRQLSDVLDAFTEHSALIAPQRRHNCVTAARRQRDVITSSCRGRDDVSTQTDDVSVAALNSHDDTDMHVRHTHTRPRLVVHSTATINVVIYEPL